MRAAPLLPVAYSPPRAPQESPVYIRPFCLHAPPPGALEPTTSFTRRRNTAQSKSQLRGDSGGSYLGPLSLPPRTICHRVISLPRLFKHGLPAGLCDVFRRGTQRAHTVRTCGRLDKHYEAFNREESFEKFPTECGRHLNPKPNSLPCGCSAPTRRPP